MLRDHDNAIILLAPSCWQIYITGKPQRLYTSLSKDRLAHTTHQLDLQTQVAVVAEQAPQDDRGVPMLVEHDVVATQLHPATDASIRHRTNNAAAMDSHLPTQQRVPQHKQVGDLQ